MKHHYALLLLAFGCHVGDCRIHDVNRRFIWTPASVATY
jgi:hypothetical protein